MCIVTCLYITQMTGLNTEDRFLWILRKYTFTYICVLTCMHIYAYVCVHVNIYTHEHSKHQGLILLFILFLRDLQNSMLLTMWCFRGGVSKLWPAGQILPCFCLACKLRMVFTFFNGWKQIKIRIKFDDL